MKVFNLKISPALNETQKLFKAILEKDRNAFKATSIQFLRNNHAYNSKFIGFIA
ncbi:hypothetical protein WG906_01390 [Pedobacter sp. P351]|uniref:hypothetical protein n=1 Tax=Pedobacter superstes TaxID=3133441 RepID=UPI0030B78B0E